MKAINQYDYNGTFIRRWKSASAAAKALGIHRESISQCLNGKILHTSEYSFKFAETDRKNHDNKQQNSLIFQYDLDGIFIKSWDKISTISDELNIHRSSISDCIYGRLKSAGNYIWKYEEQVPPKAYKQNRNTRKIKKYDLEGIFLEEYPSIKEAANDNNVTPSAIDSCLRGRSHSSAGYIWKYSEDKTNTANKSYKKTR